MAKRKSERVMGKWDTRVVNTSDGVLGNVHKTDGVESESKSKRMIGQVKDATAPEAVVGDAKNVPRVSMDAWKKAVVERNLPRALKRAKPPAGEMSDFAKALLEYQKRGLEILETMPDMTVEDRQRRLLFWNEYMRKFSQRSK